MCGGGGVIRQGADRGDVTWMCPVSSAHRQIGRLETNRGSTRGQGPPLGDSTMAIAPWPEPCKGVVGQALAPLGQSGGAPRAFNPSLCSRIGQIH